MIIMQGGRLRALVLASLAMPVQSGMAHPDEAARHLRAAARQAAGDRALLTRQRAWCDAKSAPADGPSAQGALRAAEQAYRATSSGSAGSASPAILRRLVVQRECAAHQATRLLPLIRRPVWLLSELTLSRPGTATHAEGMRVEAFARNVDGPVVNSRITFSQGSHMSCFGLTDARGAVRCTLVDTHPHGPDSNREDDEAHEGPLIASLAGSVSTDRVELPAVVQRGLPAKRAVMRAPPIRYAAADRPEGRDGTREAASHPRVDCQASLDEPPGSIACEGLPRARHSQLLSRTTTRP